MHVTAVLLSTSNGVRETLKLGADLKKAKRGIREERAGDNRDWDWLKRSDEIGYQAGCLYGYCYFSLEFLFGIV